MTGPLGGPRRILVVGATGAQGGSVARHLLGRGVTVRVLTRRPGSAAACRLRAAGAEVAAGDLGDRSSLRTALQGCWGVFGVTSFCEHFEAEVEHGRNLLRAAAGAEVEHCVLSTQPSARELSGGALTVPWMDGKAELEDYARTLGVAGTCVRVAFYYENLLLPWCFGGGRIAWPQGDVPLAAVAVEDVGGVVAALLERPGAFPGRTLGVVGDERAPAEYAAALSRALGRSVAYEAVSAEHFRAALERAGVPRPGDVANAFEHARRFAGSRRAELEECRRLFPALQGFARWAERNRHRLRDRLGS